MTTTVIDAALEEEMADHLGSDKHVVEGRNRANSRNGKRSKTVVTDSCGRGLETAASSAELSSRSSAPASSAFPAEAGSGGGLPPISVSVMVTPSCPSRPVEPPTPLLRQSPVWESAPSGLQRGSGKSRIRRFRYGGSVRVTVFLSSNTVPDRYVEAARELGGLLGRAGHTVVWGGTDLGLMKVLVDAVEDHGGTSEGVSVRFLERYIRPDARVIVTENLADRKRHPLIDSDAVVVLPGGTGTLDEATDAIEMRRHGLMQAPLVVLDTDGFYYGLRDLLQRMDAEDFLNVPLSEVAQFVARPAEVLEALESRP